MNLISESKAFNLVIGLNKVKQWAFFRFSPCRLSLVEQLAAVPGFAFFRFSPFRPWKPPFSVFDRETDQLLALQHDKVQVSGHAFQGGAGAAFFWLIW